MDHFQVSRSLGMALKVRGNISVRSRYTQHIWCGCGTTVIWHIVVFVVRKNFHRILIAKEYYGLVDSHIAQPRWACCTLTNIMKSVKKLRFWKRFRIFSMMWRNRANVRRHWFDWGCYSRYVHMVAVATSQLIWIWSVEIWYFTCWTPPIHAPLMSLALFHINWMLLERVCYNWQRNVPYILSTCRCFCLLTLWAETSFVLSFTTNFTSEIQWYFPFSIRFP